MIRKEAVAIIAGNIGKNPIVSANGFMSRDLFEANDKECRKCSTKFLPTRQTRHRRDDWRPGSSNHSKYFEKQAAL